MNLQLGLYYWNNFFFVRLILYNFCIVLNLANNPCDSESPYRRNDDAISCDTQSCPRRFRCNRGYGYAICCRSFDHISFEWLYYFFFINIRGFLQIKLFLAFHCIIFTFDNLLEDYRRCPPRGCLRGWHGYRYGINDINWNFILMWIVKISSLSELECGLHF